MIESYPLYWPEGKPRTQYRTRARFKTTLGLARDSLLRELDMLKARDPIISTNIRTRRDGLPYAGEREPADPGVAVYFTYKGHQHCFACDRWDTARDNIQAIRLTIEALRGITRWGSGDMMEQAFRGFEALPAPMGDRQSWWEVLNVRPNAALADIEAAYRSLAMKNHPDRGGDVGVMAKINVAYGQARESLS